MYVIGSLSMGAIATPTAEMAGSAVRWHILFLLCLASLLAYIFRFNVSIAGLQIRTELGLTDLQLSGILSGGLWGYALFQLPGGLYGQVKGPRVALTWCLVLWSVFTMLTGILPGTVFTSAASIFASLVVLRFLLGASVGPLFPIVGGTIAAWFPVSRWAYPNALSTAALNVGSAVTGPLVAWLMVTLGWRESFYLTAPLGLGLAGIWWWYGRDDPSGHPRVSPAELTFIRADGPAQSAALPLRTCARLLKSRDALLLMFSYLCMNMTFYIFFSWFFIYLVDVRGFTALQGGFLAALPWFVAAAGATAGGELCDRLCKRIGPRWGCRVPAIAGLLASGILLFVGAAAPNASLAITLLSLCFAANQFTDGAYWQGTIFVSGRYAAAGCGVLNTGGNFAGILVTPMVPLLKEEFGWFVALASGAVFSVIAALLWLFIRADRTIEDVSAGS